MTLPRINYQNRGVFILVVMSWQLLGLPKKAVAQESLIKQQGGEVFVDGTTHVTGAMRYDKYLETVGVSTPTTPTTNHARIFLNSTTRQVCTLFDNGSVNCFITAVSSFPITSVVAGLGLSGGGTSGTVTLNLSTPILAAYLPDLSTSYLTISSATITYLQVSSAIATYLTNSSATVTYLQLSSATVTYLMQSSATATYLQLSSATSTYLQQSSATATYLQQSSATATYLQNSSATVTYLQISSATINFARLASSQTFSGANTFLSTTTISFSSITAVIITGVVTPSTGSSLELIYSGGGIIQSYNRTASADTKMTIKGDPVFIGNNATDNGRYATFTDTGTNVFGPLTLTGTSSITITTITPTHIVGSTDGSEALSSDYGYYTSSCATAVSVPTSGNFGDLVTVTLTAGDYNLVGQAVYAINGSTWSRADVGISSFSANSASGLTNGDNFANNTWVNGLTPTSAPVDVPLVRVLLNGTTTYNLKIRSTYSVATPTVSGCLKVRRVR